MKGRQLNFYLTPEDLAECERRIKQVGSVVQFEFHSTTPCPVILSDMAVVTMGKSWLRICLSKPNVLDDLQFRYVKEQDYFAVDTVRSPVIELDRCFYDGIQLRRGRLYFVTQYYNENKELIAKAPEFVHWAEGIFASAKRELKRDPELQSYMGRHAESLRESGKCKFIV